MAKYKYLTEDMAAEFFSELYGGRHHIPGFTPKKFGDGFCVIHDRGDMATFDYSELTRLVLMAHHYCIRSSVIGVSKNKLRIAIWLRQSRTEGDSSLRHPTIETAIESKKFNHNFDYFLNTAI